MVAVVCAAWSSNPAAPIVIRGSSWFWALATTALLSVLGCSLQEDTADEPPVRTTSDIRLEFRGLPVAADVVAYNAARGEIYLHRRFDGGFWLLAYKWEERDRRWHRVRRFAVGRLPGPLPYWVSKVGDQTVLLTEADRPDGCDILAHTLDGDLVATVTLPYGVVNHVAHSKVPVLVANRGVSSPHGEWPTPLVFVDLRDGTAVTGPVGLGAVPLTESLALYAQYDETFSSCHVLLWNVRSGGCKRIGNYTPALGAFEPLAWSENLIAAHSLSPRAPRSQGPVPPDLVIVDLRVGTRVTLVKGARLPRAHRSEPILAYTRWGSGEVELRCLACERNLVIPGHVYPVNPVTVVWGLSGAVLCVPEQRGERLHYGPFSAYPWRVALLDCSPHLREPEHRKRAARLLEAGRGSTEVSR